MLFIQQARVKGLFEDKQTLQLCAAQSSSGYIRTEGINILIFYTYNLFM